MDTEHTPQIVNVDRFSDDQLMQYLALAPHDLDKSDTVMLVEAWRRGLFDELLIRWEPRES